MYLYPGLYILQCVLPAPFIKKYVKMYSVPGFGNGIVNLWVLLPHRIFFLMSLSDSQVHVLYRFEEQQHIKFEVYDVDTYDSRLEKQDFLGHCETTLGHVRFLVLV
jgi:hypothetical protein